MSDRRLDSSEMHLKLIILLAVEEEREDYQYCSPSLIEHKPEKKYLSDSAEDTPREKDIENKDNRTCCATVTVTVLKMKHSNLNEDFRIQCETLPTALERGSPYPYGQSANR